MHGHAYKHKAQKNLLEQVSHKICQYKVWCSFTYFADTKACTKIPSSVAAKINSTVGCPFLKNINQLLGNSTSIMKVPIYLATNYCRIAHTCMHKPRRGKKKKIIYMGRLLLVNKLMLNIIKTFNSSTHTPQPPTKRCRQSDDLSKNNLYIIKLRNQGYDDLRLR